MSECIKCGQCCRQINFRVPLDPELAELFSAHYGHKVTTVGFHVEHRCVHLTTDNLCGIYDERPEYCRQFKCETPGMVVVRTKGCSK